MYLLDVELAEVELRGIRDILLIAVEDHFLGEMTLEFAQCFGTHIVSQLFAFDLTGIRNPDQDPLDGGQPGLVLVDTESASVILWLVNAMVTVFWLSVWTFLANSLKFP